MAKSFQASFLSALVLCCSFLSIKAAVNSQWVQRLNRFQEKYNNSRSDIIFLLDLSGSLSDYGFQMEKKFVNSLLSEISVQPIATRLAVVTFEQSAARRIDYIDYNGLDKNKCTFSKDFARIKHAKGPATNMNAAFDRARRILNSAKSNGNLRQNVNTVIVLLTDGWWNLGGNPKAIAESLRSPSSFYAEIISVGVGYVSQWQLRDIAGIDSNVIMANSFTQFEELATKIRGDQMEKLYQPVDVTKCGKVCDQNARCSCGTISGIYQCACTSGYYGSGDPGKCWPCPFGTYKEFSSPDPCKLCPAHSSTKATGSMSLNACQCFEGYKGNPGNGVACKIVECPPQKTTIPNGRIENCGNKYQETCTFACNQHHHILGETSQSKKIVCQKDGTWSMQTTPSCIPIQCPALPTPPKMIVKYTSRLVGGVSTFECITGYRRNGTDKRTCRNDGQWSGEQPSCDVIKCPSLRRVDNVNITPERCINSKTNFDDGCAYSCKLGYTLVSGNQARKCQADGTWSGTELVCEDKTPPTITCPDDIDDLTDEGKQYKEIAFKMPEVRDNSDALVQSVVTVTQLPSSIKSPYKFPINDTTIIFTATDEAGNSHRCTFRIKIKDREAPVFTYCPPDISSTQSSDSSTEVVTWDPPTYKDNSGYVELVHQSHKSGATFPIGPINLVRYTVRDYSGNEKKCEFHIKIESRTCPKRDPPINGALALSFSSMMFDLYQAQCMSPYVPNGPMSFLYACYPSGDWTAFPDSRFPSQWPDCTAVGSMEGMSQRMKLYYYSGNCHESIQAQEQIKNNFLQVLNVYLQKTGKGGCADPNNAMVCKAENVKIKCGKLQSKKRSLQNEITIQVDLEVITKSNDASTQAVVSGLASAVNSLGSASTTEANAVKNINVGQDTLRFAQVQPVGSVMSLCSKGAVLDSYASSNDNITEVQGCVACVAGKYYDLDERKCKYCPVGTYTQIPGRLGCSLCPKGKTTPGVGTSNATECRAPCGPGTFSATGLQGCQFCPKGTYQSGYYGKNCVKCPGTTTTVKIGASSLRQCGMPCQPGTYSASGAEPCTPCPKGTFQVAAGSDKCRSCPSGRFTHGVGVTSESDCQAINHCASNPCINGASCKNEADGFTCSCKIGFFGNLCQNERDECACNPCFGDAVNGFECMCPLGYQGTFCEDKKTECSAGKCQNGGKCSETPDGFTCSCAAGFTGLYCEATINECASMPCKNKGRCIDSANGFRCECKPGFTGELCEDNVDDCAANNLCQNGGVCVDGDSSFTCQCKPGFGGSRCEVNIDECGSNPCRNGGVCVDAINGYKCHCTPTFYGNNCQTRQQEMNFDLVFSRDTQGYAESNLKNQLGAFTLSFWMKGVQDDLEAGTPVSYAVNVGDSLVDNALVVRDPESFIMVIMGKEIESGVSVNDGNWHHVAFSWSSGTGSFAAYQDGLKISESVEFQKGQKIPAGGYFILGQEQDEVGRNFSLGEAFYGSMSQLNLWNKVLSDSEISEMSRYRCDGILGNELAWPDFLQKRVEVNKVNEFCTVKYTKFSTWNSRSTPSNGIEHEAPTCSNSVSAQCMSVNKETTQGVNLIDTECSSAGYTCKDSDQTKYDPNNSLRCKDFQARFECPYTKRTSSCSNSPCKNGASCIETLQSYRCQCIDGYGGKNCEIALPCYKLKTIPHGSVSISGNTFSFRCNAGYRLSSSGSLYCRAGSLSGPVPTCVDINECAASNGGCDQLCVNTEGSFKCQCNNGYELRNGRCVDINECEASSHSCQHHCINKRGSHACACRIGYVLAADKRSCERKTCPSLSSPANGAVSTPDRHYDGTATYSCNSGYKLTKATRRTCDANGQWSGEEPSCQAVTCVTLGGLLNGQSSNGGTNFGSTNRYTCNAGYQLIGSAQRSCQQDGTWSGTMPRCVRMTCQLLPNPANGKVVGTSAVQGATVLFFCNPGYMLSSSSSNFRTCRADGSWTGSQPTCIAVRCPAKGSLANGAISSDGDTVGKKLVYTCNEDYGLSGLGQRICLGNGEWSGSAPACVHRTCDYPGIPQNGDMVGSSLAYGSKVHFSCKTGFKLVGDSVRLCLESGKWTGANPVCQEIVCGDPGTPANGAKHGNDYTFGKLVGFDCKPGYSLRGSILRKCQDTGKWDGVQPVCTAGVCGSSSLIGPSGTISSPNYPNGYGLNEYCRWAVTVASHKKASIEIKNLKTELGYDSLEIRDGSNGQVISRLSGLLPKPMVYTSSSNKLDLKFISDGKSIGAVEGFKADYFASTCGGHLQNIGDTFTSPSYPSNYPRGVSCVWQFSFNERIELDFSAFKTTNSEDKVQIWSSLTTLTSSTFIGEFYGSKGSLLKVPSDTGAMYIKFTSGSYYPSSGFQATIKRSSSAIGK
eukprot:gene716-10430_t